MGSLLGLILAKILLSQKNWINEYPVEINRLFIVVYG